MILNDLTIKGYLETGDLFVGPLTDNSIQPASIDLRVGDSWTVYAEGTGIVHLQRADADCETYDAEKIHIQPGQFVLATTLERVCLPEFLAGDIKGRSSVGRQGLIVETAGYIDPGFRGHITLELFNASDVPIVVETGTRICQLVLSQLTGPAAKPYNGKYNDQVEAQASKMGEDDEATKTDKSGTNATVRTRKCDEFGVQVENIVQAVARDCLSESLLRLDANGKVTDVNEDVEGITVSANLGGRILSTHKTAQDIVDECERKNCLSCSNFDHKIRNCKYYSFIAGDPYRWTEEDKLRYDGFSVTDNAEDIRSYCDSRPVCGFYDGDDTICKYFRKEGGCVYQKVKGFGMACCPAEWTDETVALINQVRGIE